MVFSIENCSFLDNFLGNIFCEEGWYSPAISRFRQFLKIIPDSSGEKYGEIMSNNENNRIGGG